MDWYPLWNSLRIAAISTFSIFFAGIFATYYIAKLPRLIKGELDVILTLPLVLPPTLVGYLLLHVLDPNRLWKSLPFFRACSPQSCSSRRIRQVLWQRPALCRPARPDGSTACGYARKCRYSTGPASVQNRPASRQKTRTRRVPCGTSAGR